ncbi:MAG: hypothetical protein Q9216_001252 [Gyalolechia sp. 2 TL-2023]
MSDRNPFETMEKEIHPLFSRDMEQLEPEIAPQNVLEDDEENQESLTDNEYPDPNFLSPLPWWRDLYLTRDLSKHDQEKVPQVVTKDQYPQRQIEHGPDNGSRDSGTHDISCSKPRVIGEGCFHPALAREQDGDADSTFELALEDTTDESLSGLSQACSEDYNLASQPSTSRKRGRISRRKGMIESDRAHGETMRRSQKGIKRGPRRPLEPSDEFKSIHTSATAAFIDADYETAEQLTLQAILLNPEMYAAHSLLSEIHSARGDYSKALTALFNGAHTRPRDIEAWESLAHMLLARPDEENSAATDALYCYSRIIQVDPQNVHARHQRAALNRRLGYVGRAATEYEHLLKILPHNLTILRSLAELYTETDSAHRAMEHYGACIRFYQSQEPKKATTFTWSDVNIYVELFADQKRYLDGILELKSLSRWLLGRRGDTIWENFQEDDREWDMDDYPRRVQVKGFQVGFHTDTSYGKGMPLELHVKLGSYRLKVGERQIEEATRQFELLNPEDSSSDAILFQYPDMFRDAADALRSAGFYRAALRYYEPLQQVTGYADVPYYIDMLFCHKSVGLKAEAEACYRRITNLERERSNTRIPSSPVACEAAVAGGTAFDTMDRAPAPCQPLPLYEAIGLGISSHMSTSRTAAPSAMLIPRPSKPSSKLRNASKRFQTQVREDRIRALHGRTLDLLEKARSGDLEALSQWMTAAQELVDEFRSHRGFFPIDRSLKAYVQTKPSAIESLKHRVDQAMQKIVDHAKEPDDGFAPDPAVNAADFRACALIADDVEMSCSVARWFMKEFQFVTDGYRLFSTINRLCNSPNTWFNCGPTQKFVRRQLKAMDCSLVDPNRRHELYQEKASYTTRDDEGRPIRADDLDLALLMLYGYILYLGKSFALSLNYFFRAFALDPRNPVISLCLALAYIQHAVKRQSSNRHHLITQGLSFLFRYYAMRRISRILSEQQEAEFNVARTYHLLGFIQLAVPYYEQCILLGHGSDSMGTSQWDEFSAEAAFALRTIWAAGEETGKALDITQKYLVV